MMQRGGTPQQRRGHRPSCECPQCVRRRTTTGRDWPRILSKVKYAFLVVIAIGAVAIISHTGAALWGAMWGYEQGQADRNMWHGLKPNLQTQTGYGDQAVVDVNTTATMTIDGYTIKLRSPSYPGLENETVGYTYGDDTLYIENGREVSDVYGTCVHEKLHNTAPDAPHKWIYRWENSVDGTCLAFIYRLGVAVDQQ